MLILIGIILTQLSALDYAQQNSVDLTNMVKDKF